MAHQTETARRRRRAPDPIQAIAIALSKPAAKHSRAAHRHWRAVLKTRTVFRLFHLGRKSATY
jgi:hypothetical protein